MSTILGQSARISDVIDSFIETARMEQSLRGESVAKYRQLLIRFKTLMGDIPISRLTADCVLELKVRLLASGVGPSHINGMVHALKRLVEYCRNRRMDVADLTGVRPLAVVAHAPRL